MRARKEEIGEADGPNQSRYISLSRFALEEELVMLEKTKKKFEEEIVVLKHIQKEDGEMVVTVIAGGKEKQLLLTKDIEDFSHGIISEVHPVGQILKNNPKMKLVISEEVILKELKKLRC